MRKRDISSWKVRKACCLTCPFRIDPATGCEQDVLLANRVRNTCLRTASQICHGPRLHGKREFELCRGARDFQLMIFHRLGVLDVPSDESWERKQKEAIEKGSRKHRAGDRVNRRLNRLGSHLPATR